MWIAIWNELQYDGQVHILIGCIHSFYCEEPRKIDIFIHCGYHSWDHYNAIMFWKITYIILSLFVSLALPHTQSSVCIFQRGSSHTKQTLRKAST